MNDAQLAGVVGSSETDEWATPQWLFDQLNDEFHFTLDPCATKANAKCASFYTREDDGLSRPWAPERVWMNPPYGREIGRWVEKAFLQAMMGATVVCLIPSRTDTTWWHRFCMKAHEIRFIKGRVQFGDSQQNAPFPSCVVVFRPGPAALTIRQHYGNLELIADE